MRLFLAPGQCQNRGEPTCEGARQRSSFRALPRVFTSGGSATNGLGPQARSWGFLQRLPLRGQRGRCNRSPASRGGNAARDGNKTTSTAARANCSCGSRLRLRPETRGMETAFRPRRPAGPQQGGPGSAGLRGGNGRGSWPVCAVALGVTEGNPARCEVGVHSVYPSPPARGNGGKPSRPCNPRRRLPRRYPLFQLFGRFFSGLLKR